MSGDALTAVLVEKREMLAEAAADPSPSLDVMTYRAGLAAGLAHGALAALDAVLSLTDSAEARAWDFSFGGDMTPVTWTLDPDGVRAAILAALGGKGSGSA